MSFLPTESRTALNDLGHFIDAKLARLKQGSAIETERFRQAQYLKWCKQKFIPDPCGEEPGYERVVACFVENLIIDCNPRSKTVLGYVQSINKLFEYRGLLIPADLSDRENITSKLLHAREREETIARRRSPITKEMFVEMANLTCDSDPNSAISVTFDWLALGRVLGFRVAEYAQTTQSQIDEYEYASGNKVIKAFIPSDWRFYDEKGRIITIHSLEKAHITPRKLKVTFRIQKNRENGQSITLAADDKNHHICPVRAAYRIYLRAKRLGQSDDQPMGVFVNHQGIVRYLTANKIAEVLQSVAKTCHPDLTRDEIMCFSSHSIRVWAVVLLDEAGMNPDFIKSRLRWMGDSYRLYLRDTAILQSKHITALERSSNDFLALFGENRTVLPDIVPVDDAMGSY